MTSSRTSNTCTARPRDGRPWGTRGALAAIGTVAATLAVLHLTCTPATYVTGPAADTENYARQTGLAAFHERSAIVLLDSRR